MKVLDHFSIPYLGLKNGMHTFWFDIDKAFFKSFEDSFILDGTFKVQMDLDKRPDLGVVHMHCKGNVILPCDRCLLDYKLDQDIEFNLHIKYGSPVPDEDEVIFIDEETSKINFAQYIYEWISISIPMLRVHEDENDCDPVIIEKLRSHSENSEDSVWASLRDIKFEK